MDETEQVTNKVHKKYKVTMENKEFFVLRVGATRVQELQNTRIYINCEIKYTHFPGIRTLLLSNSRDDFGDVQSSSELDLTKILGI